MNRAMKFALPVIASLVLISSVAIPRPAHAQLAEGGGFEQMQQMAPMINMIKKKMGKKRFGKMMQVMGPMMSQMMDGQGGGFGSGFDMNAMGGMINADTIGAISGIMGGRGGLDF